MLFKIYYGVFNLPRVFFQIHIQHRQGTLYVENLHIKFLGIDLFISPKFFLKLIERHLYTQMSVQGIYQKHCITCETCLNLSTNGIPPQQCLSCRFWVLVNFGEVFALFLCAFIVYSEYSLFIVNGIKCYIMAYLYGTPNRRYIYGSCCKTLVCNCANDYPYGVFFTDICV